jgi:hypothetical protein
MKGMIIRDNYRGSILKVNLDKPKFNYYYFHIKNVIDFDAFEGISMGKKINVTYI